MEPRTIEHKKLGVQATIKETLTQRDLEAFGDGYKGESSDSASQRRGSNVRAAIRAGWFINLTPAMTPEDVADQSPAVIKLLGEWIDRIYGEVTEIPPE